MPEPMPTQPSAPRISPFFGDAGLLFSIAMVLNALAGAAIGAFGATTSAQAVELDNGLALAIDPLTSGAGFDNVAWFTVVSMVLGAAVGAFAFGRLRRSRGPVMLLWVLAVGLVGSYLMLLVALGVGDLMHPVPNLDNFQPGDIAEVFPAMNSGVAIIVESTLAVAAYWLGMFVAGDDDEPATPTPDQS